MLKNSAGKLNLRQIAVLVAGVLIASIIFIFLMTMSGNQAGKKEYKEVKAMIAEIEKLDNQKGSEVFMAIAENAASDKKISKVELTALRFEYKQFIKNRKSTAVNDTKPNTNNDIKGKQ